MIRKTSVGDVDVYIEGKGNDTIVMIHGWPDTFRLWDDLAAELGKKHICVRFTVPGFDIRKARRSYTYQELSAIFAQIIDSVSPDEKVTLLLHDWGCLFGYQYYMTHRDRVAKIIGLDVGDARSKDMKLPLGMVLFAAAYQLFLASAWLVGGKVGDAATRWLAKKFHVRGDMRLVWSGMNYPYFSLWKNALLGRSQGTVPFAPECPMLFLYGKNKPTMFHSQAFLDRISAVKSSRAVGLDAGHWLMHDMPRETFEEIQAWLSGKKSPMMKQSAAAVQPGRTASGEEKEVKAAKPAKKKAVRGIKPAAKKRVSAKKSQNTTVKKKRKSSQR